MYMDLQNQVHHALGKWKKSSLELLLCTRLFPDIMKKQPKTRLDRLSRLVCLHFERLILGLKKVEVAPLNQCVP